MGAQLMAAYRNLRRTPAKIVADGTRGKFDFGDENFSFTADDEAEPRIVVRYDDIKSVRKTGFAGTARVLGLGFFFTLLSFGIYAPIDGRWEERQWLEIITKGGEKYEFAVRLRARVRKFLAEQMRAC